MANNTGYLTEEEIPLYCNIIDGVTMEDVAIASSLIDGYLKRSYAPRDFKDKVNLSRSNRGKLSHAPIIKINDVCIIEKNPFGITKTSVDLNTIELDPENDGYFTYVGSYGINNLIFNSVPSQVEIGYSSGFEVYPERLKQACAMLASNVRQIQSYNGAKQMTSLDFQIQMTDDSFFTSDIKMLLKGLNYDIRSI